MSFIPVRTVNETHPNKKFNQLSNYCIFHDPSTLNQHIIKLNRTLKKKPNNTTITAVNPTKPLEHSSIPNEHITTNYNAFSVPITNLNCLNSKTTNSTIKLSNL